jgi:hypothetical protein
VWGARVTSTAEATGPAIVIDAAQHLIEEILRADKQRAMPVLDRLQQERGREPGLAHPGPPDEDDVLGFGQEVQLGERAHLARVDARLVLEGKAF